MMKPYFKATDSECNKLARGHLVHVNSFDVGYSALWFSQQHSVFTLTIQSGWPLCNSIITHAQYVISMASSSTKLLMTPPVSAICDIPSTSGSVLGNHILHWQG